MKLLLTSFSACLSGWRRLVWIEFDWFGLSLIELGFIGLDWTELDLMDWVLLGCTVELSNIKFPV